MSPATNSVMGSVPVNQAGIGSAMNDSTRLVGGALGIAVLGTVMNSVYLDKISVLEIGNTISPDAYEGISSSIQGAHIMAESIPDPNVSQAIIEAADHAFVAGMSDAFMVTAFVMAAASVISLLILPSKIQPTEM